MIPTFHSEAELLCPGCGGANLHQERVEVFERTKEDAPKGFHVTVEDGSVSIDEKLDGNPSERRRGLRVRFHCETCEATPTLTLAQHKGVTLVDIR